MSECSLIEENGRAHFLTKRFDRKDGRKIHMQTLCGMAHFDYRLHRAYSYEQAFNVMRALRLSYAEAKELFRRMVFNVVVRNQDDHTKNISFLMDENGKWRLSPAYDMGYAYNPQGGWTATHQMSVNGKFDNITRQDLLTFADQNNIKDAPLVIDEICERASHWQEIAQECDVPSSMSQAIASDMLLNI
jgi:serine/threonine-protein kinase HipA